MQSTKRNSIQPRTTLYPRVPYLYIRWYMLSRLPPYGVPQSGCCRGVGTRFSAKGEPWLAQSVALGGKLDRSSARARAKYAPGNRYFRSRSAFTPVRTQIRIFKGRETFSGAIRCHVPRESGTKLGRNRKQLRLALSRHGARLRIQLRNCNDLFFRE